MPLVSTNTNPIDNPQLWDVFSVASTPSPGVIAIDGIRGFERETGWDKKKGKGTQGARLVLDTLPPAAGSITLVLWRRRDFDDWDAFLPLLKYNPAKIKTAADALDIYHPALAKNGIKSVVVHKISPIRHVGKGKYLVSIDFIEWLDPPSTSIVSSVSSSKPNDTNRIPGAPPDPIGDAQQKKIAALLKQAAGQPDDVPGVHR